jgi:capsule polysaccharide export protein KpsE/RkpR
LWLVAKAKNDVVLQHPKLSECIMTDQFPTADIVRYVLRFKWIIIGLCAATTVGVYVYALTLPQYFKSTINCVPPSGDEGGIGGALAGISSTLKDIGLSKLGGKSGENYEFITLLFSRTIRDSMIKRFDLVTEYDMHDEIMNDVRAEFDDNLEVNFHAEGNYEISIWSQNPKKSVEMCNAFVEYANQISNRVQRMEAEKSVRYMERRLAMMDSILSTITDSLDYFSRTYRLFSPLDQAKASADALADVKSELLKQEMVLGLLKENYGPADPQVRTAQGLVNELKSQYEKAQTQPGFAGNFALTDAAGVGATYMRLFTEYEAYSKLKAFMLPSLEQSRLDMNKTSPALLVVDTPEPAEKRDKPKRMLLAAGSGFGVGVLTVLILLLIRGWNTMMGRTDSVA